MNTAGSFYNSAKWSTICSKISSGEYKYMMKAGIGQQQETVAVYTDLTVETVAGEKVIKRKISLGVYYSVEKIRIDYRNR